VAIKEMVSMSGGQVHHSTCRELEALHELNLHPNIVQFLDSFKRIRDDGEVGVFQVMEFCPSDMAAVLGNPKIHFTLEMKKDFISQVVGALEFLHNRYYIHRDLKPENILVSETGKYKIADFGLARKQSRSPCPLTPQIGTVWYMSPEMLLEAKSYGPAVDMWSMGLIIAELWTRKPILQGKSVLNQLYRINDMFGTIDMKTLAQVIGIEAAANCQFPESLPKFAGTFKNIEPDALNLIENLLLYNHRVRYSATDVLKCAFLNKNPKPDIAIKGHKNKRDAYPSICEDSYIHKGKRKWQDSTSNAHHEPPCFRESGKRKKRAIWRRQYACGQKIRRRPLNEAGNYKKSFRELENKGYEFDPRHIAYCRPNMEFYDRPNFPINPTHFFYKLGHHEKLNKRCRQFNENVPPENPAMRHYGQTHFNWLIERGCFVQANIPNVQPRFERGEDQMHRRYLVDNRYGNYAGPVYFNPPLGET
jgi:serine/threonine protein kinase